MSLLTLTTMSTHSDLIRPSESFTITTTSIQIIIEATPGQMITLGATSSYAAPSAKYTPTLVLTQTYTVTEYDVFLGGPQGNVWTTAIIDTSSTNIPNSDSVYPPGQKIFVVPYPCSGWSCWSAGAKAGLVTGVVLGALFLFLLFCCLRRWHKRKIWVSHGAHGTNDYDRWQNSLPGWGYPRPPQADLSTALGLRPYVTSA